MNLFKRDTGTENKIQWKPIESMEEWQGIRQQSDCPMLVFKHSTRCGISSMVLKGFEKDWGVEDLLPMYLLDLISHRDVSNQIEQDFKVRHESPQVIVWKNNEVLYSASHSSIDANKIMALL